MLHRVYGSLIYFVPVFLVASLWLLNSQKRAFMSKLDEFVAELERAEKLGKDKRGRAKTDDGSECNASIVGAGLQELVEERERNKSKLA